MKIPIKVKSLKEISDKFSFKEKEKAERVVKISQKISRVALYLLIFLLPLFFLPQTANTLDFNKQALLLFLVFISLISWLIKTLVSGKLEINLSPLNLPVIFLFLVCGLSTIFSLWTYGSFWGYPLNVSAGLLSLLGFIVFYFLIGNILTEKKEIFSVLFIFIFSGFLACLFGIFQVFGKFVLPWDFAKITSFNTIGTLNSLSIFLACLLPLVLALAFLIKKVMRFFLAVMGVIMIVGLVLINFWVSWLVLMTGIAVFLIFLIVNLKKKQRTNWIFLPMALLVLALFFITFKISLPGLPQIPIEVSPSQRAELNIARESLIENPVLGSGPGTFFYNFAKYKSKDLNETIFWNVRFSSGASEILDRLITTGILGMISLFFLIGTFFWLGFKYLREKIETAKENTSWVLGLGIFSSFSGMFLAQIFYPANFSISFFFWLLLGSFVGLSLSKTKTWNLEPSAPITIGISFLLVLVLIFGLGLGFIGVQKYLGEIKYIKSTEAWQKGETEKAINYLTEAINLNPNLDRNFREISQLYLLQLNKVLGRDDLSTKEIQDQSQIFIGNAINFSKRATDLNPENVANWNVRGFIYRNMIGILGGAENWAVISYQRAVELEPNSPFALAEIGRVYLAKVDILEDEPEIAENLVLAKENFEKSLELKSDYAPAHFQIAMIYVREENIDQAIKKLEQTKQVAPNDTGLAFQIGLLYYQDEQLEKARTEFERAITLDENYSNARYFLGLIYDRQGKRSSAISQFEKIEELNPENQEVKKILENLITGKDILEGITPSQLPIEEKPLEIGK
ncbi:tetratricopeptide repeat protein [Patescibacteria group bacterium]